MSVVIVGGNERMERQYKDVCREYRCQAKVYTKESGMSGKVGSPDLLVLFTGTMSHKMLQGALSAVKGKPTSIARSHTSSIAALRGILAQHTAQVP
ncbi:MAG: DUF2325 domain-containing protein [Oscillospiraceae bacterium]|nr:DUF2325 domain-containing protein [Oscillospiraceae bacterium]